MRYKRNHGEFEIHRIPMIKGRAPRFEDLTEFVDICFDCVDRGKRCVVFCSKGDDRTATMIATWIVVSSMSFSDQKYIAPEIAICHAENIRTDANNMKGRRVVMSEAQIERVALFADRFRKRMRTRGKTLEDREITQNELLNKIIATTTFEEEAGEEEDLNGLKKRVRDLETRNLELMNIVGKQVSPTPRHTIMNSSSSSSSSNKKKNDVSIEDALSPALSRALRSFQHVKNISLSSSPSHQSDDDTEDDKEKSSAYIHNVKLHRDGKIYTYSFAQDQDSGIVVRDSSIVLGSYFFHNAMMFSKSHDVLELKSQCGVAGILCASCGCGSVMLTDCHEALPLLRNNVSMNELSLQDVEMCTVSPFEISSSVRRTRFVGRTFGIIIAVECLSSDENSETYLLNTLLSHSSQGTSVYIAWDSVYCDEDMYLRFVARCMSYFHVSIIPLASMPKNLEKALTVRLVVMSRR
jgi:hypothetical protein